MAKSGAAVVLTIELWGTDEDELMRELAAFLRMAAADSSLRSRLVKNRRAGVRFDSMQTEGSVVKMEPKVRLEAKMKGGS